MIRPLLTYFLALLCLIGTFYCIYENLLNLAFILPFLALLFAGITAELYKESKQ